MAYTGKPAGSELYDVYTQADVDNNFVNQSSIPELKAGRRNLIINGAMQVWQRGTSGTATGSAYTSVDRYRHRDSTISRSTDVPSDEGFKYSLFYDNDGTRASINMRQIIEDGKLYTDNKAITLSFWVKGSVASNNCAVDFGDQQTTSFPLTTSWNRVVVSVPAYVRNVANIFSGGLYVDWNFGTDYPDVYITGVQLELGSVATPFEHRSYGEELALCQRYYQRIYASSYMCLGTMRSGNSDAVSERRDFPVQMRAVPTISLDTPVTDAQLDWIGDSTLRYGYTLGLQSNGYQYYYTLSGGTFFNGRMAIGGMTSTGTEVRFDAEL